MYTPAGVISPRPSSNRCHLVVSCEVCFGDNMEVKNREHEIRLEVLNEVQLINCWIGIFVSHGEKDKENLPFNLAVDTSTLLTN